MSVIAKRSSTRRKKDLENQKDVALGFKKLIFATSATAGDSGINLGSLSAPSAMTTLGFVQPNVSDLEAANLFIFRSNLTLISSLRGVLMQDLSYTIASNTQINFQGFTAEEGEIFIGVIDSSARAGMVVDARPLVVTGTLAAGSTDFNVGQPFEINKFPTEQVGDVLVYVDGVQQFRHPSNGTTGGNYQEVGNGPVGTIIRFPASGADRDILVVSNGLLAERPQDSISASVERVAGQIDAMIPTLAFLAAVPETDFQSAPNSIDLKQFGDRVLQNEIDISDLDVRTVDLESTQILQNQYTEVVGAVAFGAVTNGYGFVGSAPAITDGTELMTTNFTPSEIGSIIEIESTVLLATNRPAGDNLGAGIHLDGASAVKTTYATNNQDRGALITVRHRFVSTSLSPITVAVRGGSNSVSIETRLNSYQGSTSVDNGGTLASWIRIIERRT